MAATKRTRGKGGVDAIMESDKRHLEDATKAFLKAPTSVRLARIAFAVQTLIRSVEEGFDAYGTGYERSGKGFLEACSETDRAVKSVHHTAIEHSDPKEDWGSWEIIQASRKRMAECIKEAIQRRNTTMG